MTARLFVIPGGSWRKGYVVAAQVINLEEYRKKKLEEEKQRSDEEKLKHLKSLNFSDDFNPFEPMGD